jgi:hypothetical protein
MKHPEPELVEMMAKARCENLWFHSVYQDMWFSPDELQAAWDKGQFRWGAVNWILRNPAERLAQLALSIEATKRDLDEFQRRLNNAK